MHEFWTHDDQYSKNILATVVLTGFQCLIEQQILQIYDVHPIEMFQNCVQSHRGG